MPQVIEIKGGKCETLFDERDFAYLIEEHMGHEAAEVLPGSHGRIGSLPRGGRGL